MKIKSLLIGMLACTALVGCTSEDAPEVNNGENGGEKAYLAVKLVNPSVASRTTGDYAYGSEDEQTVTSARFYLFDANGGAYIISDNSANPANSGKNYVDVANPTSTDGFKDSGSGNVETILQAVLVINKSNVAPPASIVAVLNYTTELGTENLTLDNLKTKIANFGTIKGDKGATSTYTTKGKFVMSNSVYVDATGTIACETPIAPENICITPGDGTNGDNSGALQHPVQIYVERVAAKVQTNVTAAEAEGTKGEFFKSGNYYYANTGIKDAANKDIYARLKGWRVTNITAQSNLIKDLDATATAALTWQWNNAANFRSYWADANEKPVFKWTFNDASLSFDTNNWEYYNENTQNVARQNSQLMVAVEFVTKNGEGILGEPQPIAEWYGVKYTLDQLKTAVANSLASKLYTRTGSEGNYTYTSIATAAITFTQDPYTNESERYLCRIGVANATYYYKNDQGAMDDYSADELTALVSALQPAKIWGGLDENNAYQGGGYYYLDIIHNAGTITKAEDGTVTDTNVYGLVRNHWYKLTLSSLSGLGTPVYNPNEIIITEKPDTDYSYIAAKINVLAWRMVEQNDIVLQ